MAERLRIWLPFLLLLLGTPLLVSRHVGREKQHESRNRRALRRGMSEAMTERTMVADASTEEEEPLMDIDPLMEKIAFEKAQRAVRRDPNKVSFDVRMAIYNSTHRRKPDPRNHTTGNPIDDCWRKDRHWYRHRRKLADCGIGFGRGARGGRDGEIYVVTDPDNDDPENPVNGTLRYGVLQDAPLWIVFKRDMVIRLKEELIVTSHKTIDGRGANVEIAHGGCLTLQYVTNVIIHGVSIHDCKQTGPAVVRSNSTHIGHRGTTDGDAINIFSSSSIWIDHCNLSRCRDGLIDAVLSSTAITISNNYLSNHNKVMAFGHNDEYTKDKLMQVTLAFNHFGEGLTQRMPRARFGFVHLISNRYTHWLKYAIGGSANPTIKSEGNRYVASNDRFKKEITKRMDTPESVWKEWSWTSYDDLYENDAFFRQSGVRHRPNCTGHSDKFACYRISRWNTALTANAGVIFCRVGDWC